RSNSHSRKELGIYLCVYFTLPIYGLMKRDTVGLVTLSFLSAILCLSPYRSPTFLQRFKPYDPLRRSC
ncbi:MAG TPA: hypothetical protein VEX68_15500, partial [Bryobacteraceae bacterium]|nr:hypothetical protein [Bryobacteraceae bacterium]